jgi:hypothetical protein
VAALASQPPRRIPLEVRSIDLEDRADHRHKVLTALSVYVTAVLEDTAGHVQGGLDLRDIDTILSDLISEVTGIVRRAAEGMVGRLA